MRIKKKKMLVNSFICRIIIIVTVDLDLEDEVVSPAVMGDDAGEVEGKEKHTRMKNDTIS